MKMKRIMALVMTSAMVMGTLAWMWRKHRHDRYHAVTE